MIISIKAMVVLLLMMVMARMSIFISISWMGTDRWLVDQSSSAASITVHAGVEQIINHHHPHHHDSLLLEISVEKHK